MMRTIIQLEDRKYRQLKGLASKRSQSIAQLVREGVDSILEQATQHEGWIRLQEAAGTCHDPDGNSDVADRHDAYLADVYRS
jgi:predicted DNA-binding ribbon-helix-helix protein